MPWIRSVELIISRKDDPSKKTIFNKHRIDFEVRSTVGWPADTANITLFNLSIDEVKFLQDKSYGDMYIEIRAGYIEDERGASSGGINQYTDNNSSSKSQTIHVTGNLPTIFSGVITNAVGFRRPPEHITQLFCISKAYGASTDFKQMKPIPAKAKLIDAIKSMCDDYGFGTIALFGVEDFVMQTELPRARTFQDTFLEEFRKLLGEYNLLFTMTTAEIQVFPDTFGDRDAVNRMSKDRKPIRLDVNQVIGNPIAGIATYKLATFINPSFQPGMILDVSPLIQSSKRNQDNTVSTVNDGSIYVNGVTSVDGQGIVLNTDQSIFRWAMEDKYFIMEVVHQGSTHTIEFQTYITSILGGNTMMGGKEAAWQEMYANSGMAMEL